MMDLDLRFPEGMELGLLEEAVSDRLETVKQGLDTAEQRLEMEGWGLEAAEREVLCDEFWGLMLKTQLLKGANNCYMHGAKSSY